MLERDADIFRDVNPKGGREYEIYDPADPPRYESQASFLRRLDLFPPGEEQRLPADAFDDEVIGPEDDDE
jgi:hypothetical protein